MASYPALFLLFLLQGISTYLAEANSMGTSRQLTPEDEEVFFQIIHLKASEIETFLQTGRKVLQKIRQWQASHPAESRLGHCVVRYCITTKIPELMTTLDDENDGRRGLSLPIPIRDSSIDPRDNIQDITVISVNDVQSLFKINTIDLHKYLFKKKAFKDLYLTYIYVSDLLSKYKLLGCSFQYLISKFWEWVDSAP